MSIDTTPPAPNSKTEAIDAPIVSILTGNRFCTRCGYNLIGQAVVREPVYDLLIARCPECGSAAAVTEYPTLGQWGRRWAALLGGLWALFLVALLFPSVVSIFAFSLNFGEEASRDFRQHLSELFEADRPKASEAEAARLAAAPTPDTPDAIAPVDEIIEGDTRTIIVNPVPAATAQTRRTTFQGWWSAQDQARIRRDAGSWWEIIDTRAFILWIPGVLVTFFLGAIWSVVLIHKKRRWLPVVTLIVFSFAGVIATMLLAELRNETPASVYMAARQVITPAMTWLGIAGFTVSMLLGMMLGRPIVRGLLRLLVPPRVCSNFSMLWTAEGLRPPV